jgi:hypothetical protein
MFRSSVNGHVAVAVLGSTPPSVFDSGGSFVYLVAKGPTGFTTKIVNLQPIVPMRDKILPASFGFVRS